jgi:transposase InsO family protein
MCRVLEVSTSGYYQWRKDVSSQREADDKRLIDLIKVLHAESYGGYRTRRIVRGLKQQGILVNIKRIRRLMRQIGIKGKGTPKKFVKTTDSSHDNPVAENHLARRFTVDVPNTKWVSDITYIWTESQGANLHQVDCYTLTAVCSMPLNRTDSLSKIVALLKVCHDLATAGIMRSLKASFEA